MSGYTKLPQQPDFGTRLPQTHQFSVLPQPSYPSFTSQAQYAPSPTTTAHSTSYSRSESSEQSSLLASSLPEPSMYSSGQYRPSVELVSLVPSSGRAGENVAATITSSMDLANRRSCSLIFGTARTKVTITKIDEQPTFRVIGTVPELVGSNPARVLLEVRSDDPERHDMDQGTYDLGSFTYTEASDAQRAYSPPRKRKASIDEEQHGSASKRLSRPPIRPKSVDYGSYGYQAGGYNDPQVAPGYGSTPDASRHYALYPGYDQPSEAMPPPAYPQSSPSQYSYASYSASPESSIPATSGHSWSQPHSSGSTLSTSGPVGGAYDMGSQGLGAATSRSDEPVPTLVRTSTLPQLAQQGSPGGNGFNPYARGGLNKAQLNMEGDLLEMAKNWSSEEWTNRRRLVRFYRYQKRDTIHARFEAANPNEKHPDSIIVSCIWWAEKNACYVTSVDCISLLESLIAVRFTVEEKNRIRRNLEGFRPLTVSKAKPDSENFFKLIMAFPPPKPRNIEKDVKVFPWSILPMALKKIIGKYSASYATTASFIPATPGTTRRPYSDNDPSPSRLSGNHAGPSNLLPDPVTTSAPIPTSDAMAHHSTAGTISHLHPPLNLRTGRTDANLSLTLAPAPHLWESQLPAIPHSLPPPQRTTQWDVSPFVDASQSASHLASSAGYYHPPPPLAADDREPLSAGSQGSHQHLPQLH